jgi:sucrose-phosphate synthase
VAGDSGNDSEMLIGDTLAVVVGNHSSELEHLRGLEQVYFAQKDYAGGILEGLEHYNFGKPVSPVLEKMDG